MKTNCFTVVIVVVFFATCVLTEANAAAAVDCTLSGLQSCIHKLPDDVEKVCKKKAHLTEAEMSKADKCSHSPAVKDVADKIQPLVYEIYEEIAECLPPASFRLIHTIRKRDMSEFFTCMTGYISKLVQCFTDMLQCPKLQSCEKHEKAKKDILQFEHLVNELMDKYKSCLFHADSV